MANVALSSFSKNAAQAVHCGLNVANFRISASTSISGGDVQLIGRLPHGGIPVDSVFYPQSQVVAKFGTSASQELFLASATYSTVTRQTRNLGSSMQVSLSDDLGVRYEAVTMVGTGGASLGYIGDLVVSYLMPGQTL